MDCVQFAFPVCFVIRKNARIQRCKTSGNKSLSLFPFFIFSPVHQRLRMIDGSVSEKTDRLTGRQAQRVFRTCSLPQADGGATK